MKSRDSQTARHGPHTDDQFCHRCGVFERATWQEDTEFTLHDSFHDLEVTATQGCSFCRLIRQAIYFEFPNVVSRIQDGDNDLDEKPATIEAPVYLEPVKSTDRDASDRYDASDRWDCFRIIIPAQRLPDLRVYRKRMIALLLCSRTDLEMTSAIHKVHQHMTDFVQPPPTPSTTLQRLGQWLSDCSSQHVDSCMRSVGNPQENPTRLLDLGSVPTDEPKIVSLTSECLQKYFALSYCWGHSATRYVTTEKVLAQNMLSVPISRLPRVFQDAIFVTRALGGRYLWIDALCIIQDSRQDWETESVKMASVYHNAFCTIAATMSYDADQSFFGPRDAFLYPVEECELASYVFHQPIINVPTAVNLAPMNQRAWCYQERVLSRRTVHFSHQGVFWECLKTFGAECFPLQSPTSLTTLSKVSGTMLETSHARIALILNFITRKDLRRRPDVRPTLQLMWLDLMEQVSKCGLTQETDRLPALSGVAQLMAGLTDDEYIAGMWKSSLLSGLQWCVAGKDTGRSDAYIGPSWSWISTNGGVIRADKEWDRNVRERDENPDWISRMAITDVAYVLETPSPHGGIKSAEIRIRSLTESRRAICTVSVVGPMVLTEYPNRIANLEFHRDFDLFPSTERDKWPDFLNFLPTSLDWSDKTYLQYLILSEPEDVGPLYRISTNSTIIPVRLEKELFNPIKDCTFLEIKRRSSVRHPGTWDIHALILETVDAVASVYRRAGYAKLQSSSADHSVGFYHDNPQQRPFFSSSQPVEVSVI